MCLPRPLTGLGKRSPKSSTAFRSPSRARLIYSAQCTGRTRLPSRPVRRLSSWQGVAPGKDRFLRALPCGGAYAPIGGRTSSAGEGAVCLLLGVDRRGAGILSKYCEGLLHTPLLAREVTRLTCTPSNFATASSLEISTNDARLVRGRSAIAVLGSETAHWRTDERAASNDEEVVGAAEPSLAMCPDGGLLVLGSQVTNARPG